MSLFDEEITTESLEDLGFIQIGRNKWLYLFTSLFTLTGQGDLKYAYDELIYYPKKKYLITKNGRQKSKHKANAGVNRCRAGVFGGLPDNF